MKLNRFILPIIQCLILSSNCSTIPVLDLSVVTPYTIINNSNLSQTTIETTTNNDTLNTIEASKQNDTLLVKPLSTEFVDLFNTELVTNPPALDSKSISDLTHDVLNKTSNLDEVTVIINNATLMYPVGFNFTNDNISSSIVNIFEDASTSLKDLASLENSLGISNSVSKSKKIFYFKHKNFLTNFDI